VKYFLYSCNNLLQATNFICFSQPEKKRTSYFPVRQNQVKPKGDYANGHSGCQVFFSNNYFALLQIQRKEQIPYGRINYLLVYALSDTLLSLLGPFGSRNYNKR